MTESNALSTGLAAKAVSAANIVITAASITFAASVAAAFLLARYQQGDYRPYLGAAAAVLGSGTLVTTVMNLLGHYCKARIVLLVESS